MIRVLLAEDQAMVRGALAALLALEGDLQVVAQAQDGEEAWRLLQELRPEVLIADIEMPKLGGLELAQRVRARQLPVRIIILTTFGRSAYLRRALELEVEGYILKDQPAAELAQAVRRVMRGERVIASGLALKAWQPEPLSERELALLRLVAKGKTTAEIARHQGLSEGTVRNYLSELFARLGVHSRWEAVRLAQDQGWI